MHGRVQVDERELERICRRWRIRELSLFGSVLRPDFAASSDIDVLVAFEPEHTPSLFDLATIAEELEELFGRRVDLLTRGGVERCRNANRRRAILDSVEVVYAG